MRFNARPVLWGLAVVLALMLTAPQLVQAQRTFQSWLSVWLKLLASSTDRTILTSAFRTL